MSCPNALLRIDEPTSDLDTGRAAARPVAMSSSTERACPVTEERAADPAALEAARCAEIAAVETKKGPGGILEADWSDRQPGGKPRHPPGTPTARIYQHGRSPMQSGRARESIWLLKFDLQYPTEIDFLMGWTSSRDMLQQVELRFSTLDEAVAFAKRRGLQYVVAAPHGRKVRPKSYADNFRHDRLLPWTH